MKLLMTMALAATLVAPTARATPLTYQIVLTLEAIRFAYSSPQTCTPSPHSFGCDVSVGDEFPGVFRLAETTAGLPDGFYVSLPLATWRVAIGGVTWDAFAPSDFWGFRDGYAHLFGASPGMMLSTDKKN